MRQAIQALALVTFDAPAEFTREALIEATADALRTGSFATVEPTAVEVRALIEEAAIFNNNGDQWEAKGRTISKPSASQYTIALSFGTPFGAPLGEDDRMAARIAEALNFMEAAR